MLKFYLHFVRKKTQNIYFDEKKTVI